MKVKIIKREGKAVLVEYQDGEQLKRVSVPTETLRGSQVSKENLNAGIPYGDLDGLELDAINADDFIKALNQHGIWTRCELLANMSAVRNILLQGVINNQAKLRAFAKET